MNFRYRALIPSLVYAGLLSLPCRGEDILQETSVISELSLEVPSAQAFAQLRGASTSADCREGTGVMHLPLESASAQVLYSLLVSAHLGERLVTIWFDRDQGCEITQAQLVD